MKKDMRYARENNASSSRHVEHIVWFVLFVFVRPLSIVGRINRTYSRSTVNGPLAVHMGVHLA